MPMYDYECDNGHVSEKFIARMDDRESPVPCPCCNEQARFKQSFGKGLTWFEEGRGRWIHNMADQPVYITSHEEHKRKCKEYGVEPAGAKRGMPGCWA